MAELVGFSTSVHPVEQPHLHLEDFTPETKVT